ncbi:hypothetical protein TNCV_3795961 [Trichonephila clavipes]|nr:hypothetical protein TNCV_3795961 [Trichonephila clavipes]
MKISQKKSLHLKLLQQASLLQKPNISQSILTVSTSSSQADLLPSTYLVATTIKESQPANPIYNNVTSVSNSLLLKTASPKSNSRTSMVPKVTNNLKQSSKNRKKLISEPKTGIKIKLTPHKLKKVTFITSSKMRK